GKDLLADAGREPRRHLPPGRHVQCNELLVLLVDGHAVPQFTAQFDIICNDSSADFATVLTKNRSYVGVMLALLPASFRRLLALTTVAAVAAVGGTALAQSTPVDAQSEKPAVKPVRSIPYVSITGEDGKQRHYETNAIPLLFNRACFGWRMYLGG